MSGFLADAVVFVHLLYIGYVVVGQLAIIAAGTFKRQWGRNPWFRWTHLLAIAIVALEQAAGWECPFTTWERDFRAAAGQAMTDGPFLARVVHQIVFLGDRFEHVESIGVMFIAMFMIVLQGFLMYPPRKFRLRRAEAPAPVSGRSPQVA